MAMKSFRCAECGVGTVRPLATAGRTMRHHSMSVPVPADLRMPTCDHCGAEWVDEEVAVAIDQALEAECRAMERLPSASSSVSRPAYWRSRLRSR
jgi:hypothetical protein